MAFRRVVAPSELLHGDALTADMVGIGMRFAAEPSKEPNIEDTLLSASVNAMEDDDLRVLAVLVTWLDAHHPWINADRLVRATRGLDAPRVRAFWAAIGAWLEKDRRLMRLAKLHRGRRIDLLRAGTAYQIRQRGEDPRFAGSALRVPAGVLRDRPADVLTPEELARRHLGYRHRVLMGPTYRADMWAALEVDPTLTPTKLARQTYGSFATAWQVKQDWELLAA
jgi:hypothetical protein